MLMTLSTFSRSSLKVAAAGPDGNLYIGTGDDTPPNLDPNWQVFGNISRSAEVPSFGESVAPNFLNPSFPTIPFFDIKAQTATTYEIGTRGRRPDECGHQPAGGRWFRAKP